MNIDRRTAAVHIALMISAVLLTAFFWSIDPERVRWLPACPFHMYTGLYCPGCGMLRSIHQLLNGNFKQALSLNPLVIVLIPVLAFVIVCEMRAITGKQEYRLSARVHLVIAVIIIAFGVIRNINIYPLALLKPH